MQVEEVCHHRRRIITPKPRSWQILAIDLGGQLLDQSETARSEIAPSHPPFPDARLGKQSSLLFCLAMHGIVAFTHSVHTPFTTVQSEKKMALLRWPAWIVR